MTMFEHVRAAVTLVRAEYCEMPGLSLTPAQAARLFGLGPAVAADVMGGLLQSGFLAYTRDGHFVHADTVTLQSEGGPSRDHAGRGVYPTGRNL